MPAKARIGVIGTGWWATYAHIPTLKANPDVELVAISDIRSELLSKVGNRYEVGKTYTDFRGDAVQRSPRRGGDCSLARRPF